MLEYIHGGEEGALLGAWDVLAANAKKETMDTLIGKYKRGKYIQGVVTEAMKDYHQPEKSLKQAVAFKYQNFLSRRKFNLLCKTQSSAFDAEQEVWVPHNMKCLGIDMKVPLNQISDESVEKFVKSLDIGHVHQIPNVPGVTRTVTGLVFMIIDLHLRLPHLSRKLVWFNDNTNHFVFQFSDDGAPETSKLTMSIGSITFWNLDKRVRSREFQYLLHCVSLGEKHKILELLWQQHTDEMLLLESSVFTVCGKECTMEFQPSADMSWQSWACNELNQAATYPSPYANVHKGNMSTMGGSIGSDSNHWMPYTNVVREKHLKELNQFIDSLPASTNDKSCHNKKLAFMAEKGMRQLGKPRIGVFAERVRPDPLHCEINAWQNILDAIYNESVQRNLFPQFITILSGAIGSELLETEGGDSELDGAGAVQRDDVGEDGSFIDGNSIGNNETSPGISTPLSRLGIESTANANLNYALNKSPSIPSYSTTYGCGLAYLAKKIEEHYNDEHKRFNKLPVRLIGEQAISLARYGYRLVDCLQSHDETEGQKLRRIALSKAVQYLRNAGGLFNKIHSSIADLDELEEFCQLYFNLLVLFFPSCINVTVWTVGYAIPYHARKLYEKYKVGFGILSLQAKESKHAGLKRELMLTNRSTKSSTGGKWWQIMRSNYVRSFYLPEHQPAPTTYTSHFKSRTPSHCELSWYCDCGRQKEVESLHCSVCNDSLLVVDCAWQQKLLPAVIAILKPIICSQCDDRFADQDSLQSHIVVHTTAAIQKPNIPKSIPKCMSVEELKKSLRDKGLSTSGRKDILIRRLEGALL